MLKYNNFYPERHLNNSAKLKLVYSYHTRIFVWEKGPGRGRKVARRLYEVDSNMFNDSSAVGA